MSARSGRTGLLLVNLGTPDAPETAPVRRYLREFLSDPRVVDLPAPARWALLNLVILPFRPAKSAEAYRKIWRPEGSPLLVHSLALRDRVREALGPSWQVELAMRYGNPSVEAGLAALQLARVDRVLVLPLFPQYSSAATGSAVEKVLDVVGEGPNVPPLAVAAPFYDDRGYVEAFAAVGAPLVESFRPDHVLFSFHGLPERQVLRSDETGSHCLKSHTCCEQITERNRYCYRAQCYASARLIAGELHVPQDRWTVTFQSRLGRTPWIRPYTEDVLHELAGRGVKRLLAFCPAFVADCLETLEEIAMRARETFVEAGGEDLQLVPSLNAHPRWVAAVVALAHAERQAGERAG